MMSFLTIEDETALDSVVVFPETREKYQYILLRITNLLFCGRVIKIIHLLSIKYMKFRSDQGITGNTY